MAQDPRPALAELLDLAPHPEGGWFRRTWTTGVAVRRADAAAGTVERDGTEDPDARPSATAIHYLLCAGEQSQWHLVTSDELWLHHRGAPLELRLGGSGPEPSAATTLVLGSVVEAGQQPQVLVPAGTWQAAGPAADDVLVSCVVSPGFDFADWRLAAP
ncbi:cupin domain-containing protein [Microlunatus flavus]|uniref:DUF985 domain-containing protein n=1 Tax=Microlunatus flavus TaxID=1036181 RepID=A0A1H9AHE3_9ACTN|nr:cupin domain-containing protein [Microlunatus flavus]SEP75901.1 hypothetical protein SAMN05421756_101604 [Microlunatus flavus]